MINVGLHRRASSAAALTVAELVVDWIDDGWSTLPRCSTDEPRQAAEGKVDDRLIRRAGRQMHLDLRLHLHDARGDLHQAQPQCIELHRAPAGALWHQRAQAPQQPVRPGVQEQAELVGRRPGAGGPVGGEVGFPV